MNIKDKIYKIREEYVMLDSDLAELYQCKNGTKSINLAVTRNKNKFLEDFCFRLNDDEIKDIWFQLETKNIKVETRGGKYKNPYVFTEQGVAMLASVLKTDVAVEVSVKIIRTFVMLKKYVSNDLLEQNNVNSMLFNHENRITLLESTFDEFREKKKVNEIYFKGQIYDAYSKILDILNTATKEIIIIDNFLDKTILDMIRNIDVKVILITSNKSKLKEIDINKYNMEYSNLKLIYNDTFHDRYIIVDKTTIYHLGASINHAGSKTFSINILEDEIVKKSLFECVK